MHCKEQLYNSTTNKEEDCCNAEEQADALEERVEVEL